MMFLNLGKRNWMQQISFVCVLLLCMNTSQSNAHGIISNTSTVSLRANNIVEIKVEFNFIELLNIYKKQYTLHNVIALTPEKFSVLHYEVVKLFKKQMQVTFKGQLLNVNLRIPSPEKVLFLLNHNFAFNQLPPQQKVPYTFNDRRFYQQFFFDVKIPTFESLEELTTLSINYPKELGNIYVTYSQPLSKEIHQGEVWKLGS